MADIFHYFEGIAVANPSATYLPIRASVPTESPEAQCLWALRKIIYSNVRRKYKFSP